MNEEQKALVRAVATKETTPMRLQRWKNGRHWAVYDVQGALVCVTLYRKGAEEVIQRLSQGIRPSLA